MRTSTPPHASLARRAKRHLDSTPFSSRSRPSAEILEGFFSSLLPPSFLRGRFATFFCLKPLHRAAFFSTVPPARSDRALAREVRVAIVGACISGLGDGGPFKARSARHLACDPGYVAS